MRAQAPTDSAAADLPAPARSKVTAQHRRGRRSDRRLGREAVDHRHILEDETHAIATALAVTRAQRPGKPLGVRSRVSGANQASFDLRRRALERFGIQRVAAEEIDLLELREQSRARIAARGTLQLVRGQELVRPQSIGIEFVVAVIVTGDDQHVAADFLLAGRRQPIGPSPLDQLDELKSIRRQAPSKCFLLVG